MSTSPDTNVSRESLPRDRGGWLVSVRNPHEACQAVAAGVDVVDVKEPDRGPLGAADPAQWQAIAEVVVPKATLSIAIGEAKDAAPLDGLPRGCRFVKAGPAGCGSIAELAAAWDRLRGQLPAEAELVAVAYADAEAAAAPPALQILQAAIDAGFHWFLIDTYGKDGRSSLAWLTPAAWSRLEATAVAAGVRWALAGAITRPLWPPRPPLPPLRPDLVGLRGAVCRSGRASSLCPDRLSEWSASFQNAELK